MFKIAWQQRLEQAEGLVQVLKRDTAKIDKQIEGLLERIVEANHPKVIGAYETRLIKLEQDKLVLDEKLQKNGQTVHSFDEMFELACKFLANPWKLWPCRKSTGQSI